MNNSVKNKNTVVSNVATIDAKNPIPFEPSGESTAFHLTRRVKRYLPFLEPKDNFFQLLLEAKLLSPTNNSCVNSKTNFCIGKGSFIKDGSENKEFDKFKKRVNKKGQNFDKLIKSVFNNHFTVGNNFVEIIRGEVGNKKFMWIVNRPYLDCRLSTPNDDDICETVFISKEFRRKTAWTLVEDKAVELPIYCGDLDDLKWYKSESGTEHCVIHVKNDLPGYEYYGMPDNIASLPYQVLEYKNVRYNLDIIDNNLVVGGVIFLEGNVTQDEGKKIGQDIVYSHTGDGKRGRWTVVTGGKGITNSALQQFDAKTDGSFLDLDESVESKIVDSNNWDTALYGQQKTSGIGNGGFAYLSAVFETKNKTVIEPIQELIIQDLIQPFFAIYDDWMGTKFSDLELGFKTVSPASFIGEIDVNSCLTKDEGREILGKPIMEDKAKGSEFISTAKNKKDVQAQ
ncbi:hypothetical protein C1637_09980 [Chryseobacterium lactis]|uniref:Phage portal protein n=1 Tax=Chryseobacterium lactis TaxID=1241981 RepID=A0A3G6RBV7_CHRLC|nr:hypothetical protein [Chryseobacterium lactis]AZA82160.1 hypothetical protein EG342_09715 [Chryseobacterium lactis]AZB02541.1 hypothetical protein EG341_00570 [Chryseobacterium lactis]PNW14163.1 hypothetical protein C1637_09980 [Chryseobacterium lactis]